MQIYQSLGRGNLVLETNVRCPTDINLGSWGRMCETIRQIQARGGYVSVISHFSPHEPQSFIGRHTQSYYFDYQFKRGFWVDDLAAKQLQLSECKKNIQQSEKALPLHIKK